MINKKACLEYIYNSPNNCNKHKKTCVVCINVTTLVMIPKLIL